MKSLKDTLLNEAKNSNQQKIEDYGKALVKEWGPSFCGNILNWFITGVKEGMEENPSDDSKFQERCIDFIEKTLKDLNKDIY